MPSNKPSFTTSSAAASSGTKQMTKLGSDGRVLEVNLRWNRTDTYNDWQRVEYRVTGSRPYAANFSLFVSGKRVHFVALDAVPGGSWYGLSLKGNASKRTLSETYLVQVYEANRNPLARLGYVEYEY